MKNTLTILSLGVLCTQLHAKETAPASLDSAANAGKVSLFNGKDLTGWKGTGYEVKDGAIVCTPKGKNLITEKEYSNYVFSFEFKLPPAGNNGIAIHYPGKGNPAATGLELQVLDHGHEKYNDLKPHQHHGGVYFLQAPSRKDMLKPAGEWNQETIIVNGNQLTVILNGVVINEANLDELAAKNPKHKGVKRRSGHVGFCGHGDPVQFRNITIIDTTLPKVDLTGFKSLFNGKDLTGWKQDEGHIGHWQPRGDVLYYDSKSTAKDKNLWTEKSYKDFTLALDWRWAETTAKTLMRPVLDTKTGGTKIGPDGKPMMKKVVELDSGIYLRGNNRSQVNLWNWPCGSGEVYGYRMNRKLSQEIRAALVPKVNADHPIGAWNRMLITMKGDRLTVVLNGKTVIENAQLPGVPAEGPIALQHHGSALEFKNISIKEL